MTIIRLARVEDAAAMARVAVDSYLAAHRTQMPAAAWEKRKAEWTHEVSAQGWRRYLQGMADGEDPQECVYVAEVEDDEAAYPQLVGGADPAMKIVGLVVAHPAGQDLLPNAAEISSIYISEGFQGLGIGRKLMQAVARHMQALGMSALQIAVLTANEPARGFYEAMGGALIGEREFDEEGILLPEVVYGWPDIAVLNR